MATLEIYSNSASYTATIDGETVTGARVNIDPAAAGAARNIELSGGNLTMEFPDGVDWTLTLDGDVFVVTV